jgi:hypothetical protein
MDYDAEKDMEILNDHALFKIANYIGITGLADHFLEKIENVISFISPCNS